MMNALDQLPVALRVTESRTLSVLWGRIFLDLWSYSHLVGVDRTGRDLHLLYVGHMT